MMVRASRNQVAKSFGAAATIWPSSAMPARKSFLRKRRIGVFADLRQRLRRRTGVGFDLRLKRDGRIREIAILKGLFGGVSGGGNERRNAKQRGGKAGAN